MAIQFLDVVDFNGIAVENLVAETVTSNPTWTSADEGRLIYNSTTGNVYFGDSSQWVQVGEGSGFVSEGRTLTAGSGLTGGGDLTADRTFDIGAGTGITVNADDIEFDTTFGDARYATLSGATFSGNISLGSVQLVQGSAGLMNATEVSASLWKSSLTSAGITADGVYLFEDGSMVARVTDSGRLHITYTQNTGYVVKAETSLADNTYHAGVRIGTTGVEVFNDNSGGTPVAGSTYTDSASVDGTLSVGGAVTLDTEGTSASHAVTKNYVDTADAGKADTTTNLTAGAGLTGGGDISTDRTFAVGAGTGITVNADDIEVDTTWGDARYATLSGATFTGDVTLAGTPTSNNHAATKQYVDITAQGLSVKAPVVAIATSNITLSGAQTIDGVSVVADDRVLVAGQTDPVENGIYVAAAGAWSRASDADASGEIKDGSVLWVESGTSSGDALYVCTAVGSDPWVPDTDSSTWTKYTSISDLSAGDGLTKSGTTINVVGGTGITANADDIEIDTSVVATKYSTDVGNGADTSIAVTHNLGTKDVIVQVRANGDDSSVIVPWVATSTSVVTLSFASAPASNAYRVTVIG